MSIMQECNREHSNCEGGRAENDESSTVSTKRKEAEPPKESQDQSETKALQERLPTTSDTRTALDQATDIDSHKMKLIVRTQYWGRELKGKTCQTVYTMGNAKAPRVISSQAVLYNTEGFWGCCPSHGTRVLELQECHFTDVTEDCGWDLYLVGTYPLPSQAIHDFFLLPQNQTVVDIPRNIQANGWFFVGTCNAGDIRSGVDAMLRSLLEDNKSYGFRYHHAHIDIMMDKAFDRETPRSRKIKNEKQRAERSNSIQSKDYEHQESSVTTDGTASTEQNLTEQESPMSAVPKKDNQSESMATKPSRAPPIPRLITNESSEVARKIYPTGNQQCLVVSPSILPDMSWGRDIAYWNHVLALASTRNALLSRRTKARIENEELQWHPSMKGPTTHHYWPQVNNRVPYPVPHSPYMLPQMHAPSMGQPGMAYVYHTPMQQYIPTEHRYPSEVLPEATYPYDYAESYGDYARFQSPSSLSVAPPMTPQESLVDGSSSDQGDDQQLLLVHQLRTEAPSQDDMPHPSGTP